jgi:hypothetical protein
VDGVVALGEESLDRLVDARRRRLAVVAALREIVAEERLLLVGPKRGEAEVVVASGRGDVGVREGGSGPACPPASVTGRARSYSRSG